MRECVLGMDGVRVAARSSPWQVCALCGELV
jgi:hypothetical protein